MMIDFKMWVLCLPVECRTKGSRDMGDYHLTKKYNRTVRSLLKKEECLQYINDFEISFDVIVSDIEKIKNGKIVFADCRKVPDIYRLYCPYDFIITIYEPNCDMLDAKQMRILLMHEMLHMGVNEVDGELKYMVNGHDYEEFKVIIDRFGLDWSD